MYHSHQDLNINTFREIDEFEDNININAAKIETLFMQNTLQVDNNKFFEMILNTLLP